MVLIFEMDITIIAGSFCLEKKVLGGFKRIWDMTEFLHPQHNPVLK